MRRESDSFSLHEGEKQKETSEITPILLLDIPYSCLPTSYSGYYPCRLRQLGNAKRAGTDLVIELVRYYSCTPLNELIVNKTSLAQSRI